MKIKKKKKYPELNALKGLIREKGTSYRKVSNEIGIAVNTLSDKINGFYPINLEEVEKIAKVLSIPDSEIVKYFFPNMMRNATKTA